MDLEVGSVSFDLSQVNARLACHGQSETGTRTWNSTERARERQTLAEQQIYCRCAGEVPNGQWPKEIRMTLGLGPNLDTARTTVVWIARLRLKEGPDEPVT